MGEGEVRATLLRKLVGLAERLPNGLLSRLVEDAQFFHDWNLGKKKARASARIAQQRSRIHAAEERHWKEVKRRIR